MILRIFPIPLFIALHIFYLSARIFAGEYNDVVGLSGGNVQIPCDVSLVNKSVRYILWSKQIQEQSKVYYKVFVRGALEDAVLLSEESGWGARASFKILETPPYMLVERLTPEDAGKYTCKVSFRGSPGAEYHSNLTVIIPPQEPDIIDGLTGEVLNGVTQPYKMGDSITLVCSVKGGRPAPAVNWYHDHELLNSEINQANNLMVNNSYTIDSLTKKHRDMELLCQASNSELGPIVSKTMKLDVQYKPEGVRIETQSSSQTVGVTSVIECVSWGARPSAILTWFLDGEMQLPVGFDTTTDSGNISRSLLSFMPKREDFGKNLSCQASSQIFEDKIEDFIELDVQFAPEVTLNFLLDKETEEGSGVSSECNSTANSEHDDVHVACNSREVEEGSEVTMECDITANPEQYEVNWYHGKYKLENNMNDTLFIIDNITKEESGLYSCEAVNEIGRGISQSKILIVNYLPTCEFQEAKVVGITPKEESVFYCHVDSNPSELIFNWEYVDTEGVSYKLPEDTFTAEERDSVLTFTPSGNESISKVFCYFSNKVGEQVNPCVYDIVQADKPQPPENCSITSSNHNSILIDCVPGYNGGLEQQFVVYVFDRNSSVRVFSKYYKDTHFIIDELSARSWYEISISSRNSRGRSNETVILHAATSYPEEMTDMVTRVFPITPILGVLIGIVGALVVVAVVVVVIMRLRSPPKVHKPPKPKNKVVQSTLHANGDDPTGKHKDSVYEDVESGIPDKLKHANLYETVNVMYDNANDNQKSQEEKDTQTEDTDDVEYAELVFDNGKSKKQKKTKTKKKSKSKKDDHDDTTYASIDHVKTAQKYQEKQKRKAPEPTAPPPVGPSPENVPLMQGALESSV